MQCKYYQPCPDRVLVPECTDHPVLVTLHVAIIRMLHNYKGYFKGKAPHLVSKQLIYMRPPGQNAFVSPFPWWSVDTSLAFIHSPSSSSLSSLSLLSLSLPPLFLRRTNISLSTAIFMASQLTRATRVESGGPCTHTLVCTAEQQQLRPRHLIGQAIGAEVNKVRT